MLPLVVEQDASLQLYMQKQRVLLPNLVRYAIRNRQLTLSVIAEQNSAWK